MINTNQSNNNIVGMIKKYNNENKINININNNFQSNNNNVLSS